MMSIEYIIIMLGKKNGFIGVGYWVTLPRLVIICDSECMPSALPSGQ